MVEIKNDNNFNIGDKVWWFDAWGTLRWGTIYKFVEDGVGIYENGRKGLDTGAKLCKCWPSEEACLKAEARRVELQTAEYKESIEDVGDLVRFLLQHDINGENPDYEAKKAAEERAVELGIEID